MPYGDHNDTLRLCPAINFSNDFGNYFADRIFTFFSKEIFTGNT